MLFSGTSFGFLAFFSLHFYKERAFFLDLSFVLYLVIKDNSLPIQVNRFVSFFTQGAAYTAMKLGLPLENIAQLYSLSFVVFQFLIFLIILKLVKDKATALGLVLFNTLMMTHSFYWTANELMQGMAILFLFFGLLNKSLSASNRKKYLIHIVSLGALITCCFAHPLLNIPLAFGLIFFMLRQPKKVKTFGAYFVLLILIYFFKLKFFSNYYDNAAMSGVANFFDLYPNYYTESMQSFFGYLIKDYCFLSLALIGCTIFYLLEKKFLRLTLVLLASVLFALLINVTYAKGAHQFYLEALYHPLAVFVILPLVFDVLPNIKRKNLVLTGISVVILVGIFRIYNAHDLYTERLEWNRNLLAKSRALGKDKIVLLDKELPKETVMLSWAMAYETWIMSTIETGTTQSIIALRNGEKFDDQLDRRKLFLSMWVQDPYFEHPREYFIFPDTINGYQKYRLEEIIGKE